MSNRIKWIEHRSHKILYSDYSGLRAEELVPVIAEAEKEILLNGPGEISVINNFTKCVMSIHTKNRATELISKADAKGIKIYLACVGILGIQRTIVNLVVRNRNVYFAKSEEDARDWLVKQTLKEN